MNTTKIYTEGIDKYESESTSTNGLYILDDTLSAVGELTGLAEDEMVQSVRFDGDIAYFVTFRQVDPLFAVDVSDPTRPVILGELKIPGFSEYLHKFSEGRLFGLGYDADVETGSLKGMKMTMFDISDPTNLSEKHTTLIDSSWSEALYNHKAIVISEQRNIIAFPLEDGYAVYGYSDEQGFTQRAKMVIDGEWGGDIRGLYIGDSFYIIDNLSLIKYSLTDFSKQGELALSDQSE